MFGFYSLPSRSLRISFSKHVRGVNDDTLKNARKNVYFRGRRWDTAVRRFQDERGQEGETPAWKKLVSSPLVTMRHTLFYTYRAAN